MGKGRGRLIKAKEKKVKKTKSKGSSQKKNIFKSFKLLESFCFPSNIIARN